MKTLNLCTVCLKSLGYIILTQILVKSKILRKGRVSLFVFFFTAHIHYWSSLSSRRDSAAKVIWSDIDTFFKKWISFDRLYINNYLLLIVYLLLFRLFRFFSVYLRLLPCCLAIILFCFFVSFRCALSSSEYNNE
jgi:hypothetical protein